MNIMKLIHANISKRKGASMTFLVMIAISALMLSISLSLIIGSADFYDKKVDELNAPHYTNYVTIERYQEEFATFAQNYDGSTDVSVVNALFAIGSWMMKEGTSTNSILVLDIAEVNEKAFHKPNIIDQLQNNVQNMIILPINFRTNGFKTGEKITLDISAKKYDFTIGGFFEDAIMGASTYGANTVYIDSENFNSKKMDANFNEYVCLTVRFSEAKTASIFATAFRKFSKLSANEEFVAIYETIKLGAMTFVDIISLILIMFSMIILLIAFIVVGFTINNSISEDITTIGALKSIGYKNRVLRGSQLMQYLIIALIGSLFGALISLLTFGVLGDIIASTSGLLWIESANITPIVMTILVICLLSVVITYLSTGKYKKITPINALRHGESNHSFKKNAMPLDKYKMPLNLHLGMKRFFNSIKNNVVFCLIVVLLVFISVIVSALSYNLNTNRTAMIQMVGMEMSEIYVQTKPGVDIKDINEAINNDQEVNKTILSGSTTCFIGELEVYVMTIEDYSGLIINTIVKGRNPELINEITLGITTANTLNKWINDTITIVINEVTKSYIIVGITQDISNGGEGCNVTKEAMLSHNNTFKMDTIFVYLNEGVDTKTYYNKLNEAYENMILMADTEEQMDTILSSLGDPFAAISIIMIFLSIVIIAFVLFLIISALIRKQKKEMGIMKAIGYTNRQLIMQMLISLLPSVLLATIIGIVLGFILTNPLMSVFFSSAGLLKTYFVIPVIPTILTGMGICVASILVIYLLTLKLKSISPQKLIVAN